MSEWWFNPGNGGWCRWHYEGSPLLVYLRFTDVGGRLAPAEEYLRKTDGTPLTTSDMVDIPRARFVKWANDPHMARIIRGNFNYQAVDLATASQYIQMTIGRDTTVYDDHWVTRMLRHKFDENPAIQPPPPEDDEIGRVVAPHGPIDPTLNIPEKRPYGDAFYEQVLDLADRLEAAGVPACKVMAEANGVPHARVRMWRSEGKRRRNG